MNAELVLFFFEPMGRAGNIIGQAQCISRPGLQIIRQPLVNHNFIVTHARGQKGSAGRRDHRVGRRFLAVPKLIDEVGQKQLRSGGGAKDCAARTMAGSMKIRPVRSSNPPGVARNSRPASARVQRRRSSSAGARPARGAPVNNRFALPSSPVLFCRKARAEKRSTAVSGRPAS